MMRWSQEHLLMKLSNLTYLRLNCFCGVSDYYIQRNRYIYEILLIV